MFKQASFTAAAIALTLASGATLARAAERNVFDTETYQSMPAAVSANGLTREAVQAEYIAKREAKGIASFNPESHYFEQITDSGPVLAALFQKQPNRTVVVSAEGLTREQVRAEVLAARASGELNPFDTETYQRVAQAVRSPAPTAVAQR
jgi:hypothetical protein